MWFIHITLYICILYKSQCVSIIYYMHIHVKHCVFHCGQISQNFAGTREMSAVHSPVFLRFCSIRFHFLFSFQAEHRHICCISSASVQVLSAVQLNLFNKIKKIYQSILSYTQFKTLQQMKKELHILQKNLYMLFFLSRSVFS